MIDSGSRAVLSTCEGIQLLDGVGDTRFSATCLLLHSGYASVGSRVSVTASSTRDPSPIAGTYRLQVCHHSGFGLQSPEKERHLQFRYQRGVPRVVASDVAWQELEMYIFYI